MWVTAHLADLESDLSAIHRIDDMYSQPGPRILRLAYRLVHYPGAVQSAALSARRREVERPAPVSEEPRTGPRPGSLFSFATSGGEPGA